MIIDGQDIRACEIGFSKGRRDMADQFARTRLLYGDAAMEKLRNSRVAVFGVGGVGGYVVEALVRSGIGAIDLIDDDKVCLTNLNRQIIATHKTLGMHKVDAAAERIADINPDCRVTCHRTFFLPETKAQFDFRVYDYVVDAIDTVAGKLAIIEKARDEGVPVISSMGAGNKTDASGFEVADIYETSICPLAKVIRKECRKRGIESLKVVYSKEEALTPRQITQPSGDAAATVADDPEQSRLLDTARTGPGRRSTPGSTAFVPSVAGLIIAGEVINDLTAAL